MAVAVAAPSPDPGLGSAGNYRVGIKEVTFDNSYPTGGEPLTAAQMGLTRIRYGIAQIKTTAAAGNTVEVQLIPQADGSALLKCNAAAAEVPNATNLATLVAVVVCWGDA
jgi:hypothetical protein